MLSFKLDPRIDPLFRGRDPHMKFLATAMCAILEKADMLEEVISSFGGQEPDWSEIVAGKPLHWFNSKTRQQIASEGFTPAQIGKIEAAFKARGLTFPEGQGVQQPADPSVLDTRASARQRTVVPRPAAATPAQPVDAETPTGSDMGQSADADPLSEPSFAGHPLSELVGKSDKDLLAIEGIGPATVKEIRKAEKVAAK